MRKKVLVLGANFGGLTAALAVKHALHGDVDVTVVSPDDHVHSEPQLAPVRQARARGHDVPGRADALADGEAVPFSFGMVVPPFLGQEFLKEADGLADEKGFITVRDTYQSDKYDDIYAVGAAAAVEVPWQTPTPVGIPKTGFPTEVMAHVAAENVAAQIRGEVPTKGKAFGDIKAVCVMDAGNNGVIILADKMLPPRKHGILIPGPQAHLMKLGFEKYFMWKMRHGYVQLP